MINERFDTNWICEVQPERQKILSKTPNNPIQILVETFELCQDNFDVTNIKAKCPELYQILQEFCNNIPVTDEELRDNSRNLAQFFYKHSIEIRKCDVQLYYALLNFIDLLKIKNIYWNLVV